MVSYVVSYTKKIDCNETNQKQTNKKPPTTQCSEIVPIWKEVTLLFEITIIISPARSPTAVCLCLEEAGVQPILSLGLL